MPVLYSGGAKGADMTFERLALKQKWTVETLSFEGHTTKSTCRKILSKDDLRAAWPYVKEAAKRLGRSVPHNPYISKLICRNYYQIKDTQIVFGVGTIDWTTNNINGGTGWAIEMARQSNLQCFFFDQDKCLWYRRYYRLDENKWFELDFEPNLIKLSKYCSKITGIGTRELNNNGIKAIENLFKS